MQPENLVLIETQGDIGLKDLIVLLNHLALNLKYQTKRFKKLFNGLPAITIDESLP